MRLGATLPRWDNSTTVHDLVKYFRANPQVLALLIVCIVLGLGTFLVVMYGLISSGSTTTTGEPEGVIAALRVLAV
jgi:hypothetical protein